MMSILDDISAEVAQLSDEEIAKAAAQIQARNDRAKASMTPDRVQKMKDREKRRRALNSAILKAAKEKGLLVGTAATPVGATA